MELLDNIKWYHITILCLIAIIIFLVFGNTNVVKSEGFASEEHRINQENKQGHQQEHKQEHQQEHKQERQEHKQEHTAIKDNATAELVFYYATWCGYCKSFIPEWEKFEEHAKKNFPHLRVSKIRCEDGNEATCMQKGVKGYPTVILYVNKQSEKTFTGERSFESLVNFIKQNT